ncbi:hypothetical protein C8F04DRAFT_1179659 [Mycena alexandri]|uniref:Uncharacterized protein n=1 Tax=Mycena alexandri TaxID=1745969 RepID=A0AAD6T6G8_9AGAR|nr:hypothetical protein C8F04DRAFT_1179659 [Mycena alexandri]
MSPLARHDPQNGRCTLDGLITIALIFESSTDSSRFQSQTSSQIDSTPSVNSCGKLLCTNQSTGVDFATEPRPLKSRMLRPFVLHAYRRCVSLDAPTGTTPNYTASPIITRNLLREYSLSATSLLSLHSIWLPKVSPFLLFSSLGHSGNVRRKSSPTWHKVAGHSYGTTVLSGADTMVWFWCVNTGISHREIIHVGFLGCERVRRWIRWVSMVNSRGAKTSDIGNM